MSLPEEDLTCPVCYDIFTDPVLLSCSHSFCRSCLKRCWDTGLRECPVCRKRAPKSSAPSNLALKNVCEAVLQDELSLTLKNLQDKLDSHKRIQIISAGMIKYIKSQAVETQRLIKSQFKQLHQVLDQEESASIAAVKKEEEEKIAGMKDKIKELSAEVLSITDAISVIDGQLQED
ncbi:Tripartite motif-containing protein 35 Hemopoietic lineage switch protein 5 [Collichthys lucidus]|uniref:Tripartite motif-containing protein 35 Hemopoietic lineage switch protein 5 n=1 Tax=Collichthys lucidus TaxID=240159 RepID=A0A4U5VTM0_COLLU|nr:Tripartite motif-containing protein 35 Hemopoietic lineage switch protein 5 [Collichthys lucidus]